MEAKDGNPVEDPDDLTDEERELLLRVVEVLRRIEFGTIPARGAGREGRPDRDGREVPPPLIRSAEA